MSETDPSPSPPLPSPSMSTSASAPSGVPPLHPPSATPAEVTPFQAVVAKLQRRASLSRQMRSARRHEEEVARASLTAHSESEPDDESYASPAAAAARAASHPNGAVAASRQGSGGIGSRRPSRQRTMRRSGPVPTAAGALESHAAAAAAAAPPDDPGPPSADLDASIAVDELPPLDPAADAETRAKHEAAAAQRARRREAKRGRLAAEAELKQKRMDQIASRNQHPMHTSKVFLLLYLLFLLIFTLATFLQHGDESTFYLIDRMKEATILKRFVTSDEGPKNFFEVDSPPEIYQFLKGPFTATLLHEEEDRVTDAPLPLTPGYVHYSGQQNRMLGGIRLRQLRVRKGSCAASKYGDELTDDCYSSWHTDAEERAPFTGVTSGVEYTWSNEVDNEEAVWWGKFAFYAGSGYVVESPLNRTHFLNLVEQLKEDEWIDRSTRLLLIDVVSYNPAVNLHFIGRMAFELPGSGGVRSLADYMCFKLNRFYGSSGQAQLALELLVVIGVALYLALDIRELTLTGFHRFIRREWVVFDLLNFVIFICIFSVRGYVLVHAAKADPVNKDRFESLSFAVLGVKAENALTSVNSILLWIKTFKYLHFSSRIQFLYRTFAKASIDLFFFACLFSIFFCAFAHGGYLAFSHDVADFRSLPISFVSLFRGLTGDMNYDDLYESSRFFGPVYYVLFHVLCLLIMINMFIAILTDAYASIREEDAMNPSYQAHATLSSMFAHAFREIAEGIKRIATCTKAPPEDTQSLFGTAKRRTIAPAGEGGVQMTKMPPPQPIKSSKVADSSSIAAAHTDNGQAANGATDQPFAEINGHAVAAPAPGSLAVAWVEPSADGAFAAPALVGNSDDDFAADLQQDDDAWTLVEDLLDQQEALEKRMESMERTMGLMHALLERVARNTAAVNVEGGMSARGGPPSSALAPRKLSGSKASAPGASMSAAPPSAASRAVKAPASLPPLASRSPAAAQPTPLRPTQLAPMDTSVTAVTAPHPAPPVEPAPSDSSSSSSVAAALSAAAPASVLPGALSVSDDALELTTPVANRRLSGSHGNVSAIPFVMMSPGRSNWPPRLNPQLLQQQSQSQLLDDDDDDLTTTQPPPTTHHTAAKDR